LTTELLKAKDYMTNDQSRIAVAAVVLQIAFGAISAWSVFSVPLSNVAIGGSRAVFDGGGSGSPFEPGPGSARNQKAPIG
jgi:hypothetical protein